MNCPDRSVEAHQSEVLYYGRGQRLPERSVARLEKCSDNAVESAGTEIALSQPFGQRIDRTDAGRIVGGFRRIHFGMRHLQLAVEPCRFAEKDILMACGEAFPHFAYSSEPYAVHCCGSVGKQPYHAHGGAFSDSVEADEPSAELNHRVLSGGVPDAAHGVCPAPVEIAGRVVAQQVVGGVQIKLRGQKLGTLRSYALYICQVKISESEHSVLLEVTEK